MVRTCLVILSLVLTTSAGGCRSCSSCHDYGPPVASCGSECCGSGCCGTQRCGSASGYVDTPFLDDRGYESQEAYESESELPQPQPLTVPQ